jgi:hypothetical protein
MQTDTGRIERLDEDTLKDKKKMKLYYRIQDGEMTDRQRELMQVSKYDNRSKLGKIFRAERAKKRKLHKEGRRRNRR